MKGKFRGIRVIKRGVSPRVVDALVVGSHGTTPVTGPQLESLFGLPSTYMRFTTISAAKLHRPGPSRDELIRFYPRALRAVLRVPTMMLSGFVFPASKGSTITIQRLARHHHWRTVRRVRVGAAGSYAVPIGAGTYRVLYSGVAGDPVTIG